MKQRFNRIRNLEYALEKVFYKARNSEARDISHYINQLYKLQDKYKRLTGERYKFKEREWKKLKK